MEATNEDDALSTISLSSLSSRLMPFLFSKSRDDPIKLASGSGAMASSFEDDAPFQASRATSFKRDAQVAAEVDEEEEDQDSRFHVSAHELSAARRSFGRRSRVGSSVTDVSSSASINYDRGAVRRRQDKIGGGAGGESFWCGAFFCMNLPGVSRRRRPPAQQQSMSLSEPGAGRGSTAGSVVVDATTRASVASKAASMERFKYSSSSSGIVYGRSDEEEEQSAYFDLPLELLRISSVDTESPVTAAFLFDGSHRHGRGLKPELPDLEFSFPPPPAFSSSPPSPRSYNLR